MRLDEEAADLKAIGDECRSAADRVLASCELILAEAEALRGREPTAAASLTAAALAALEACAFQDTVGQRISRLMYGASKDPLLAGPAVRRRALSQTDVDALFD